MQKNQPNVQDYWVPYVASEEPDVVQKHAFGLLAPSDGEVGMRWQRHASLHWSMHHGQQEAQKFDQVRVKSKG